MQMRKMLALSLALAAAASSAPLPGNASAAHDAVVALLEAPSRSPDAEAAACAARLAELRRLAAAGSYAHTAALSFALADAAGAHPARSRRLRELPADCRRDVPFVGVGAVTVEAKTPRDRGANPRARPTYEVRAHLETPGGATIRAAYAGAPRGPSPRAYLAGSVLDGAFYASGDAIRCVDAAGAVACDGGAERGVRFADAAHAAAANLNLAAAAGAVGDRALARLAATPRHAVARTAVTDKQNKKLLNTKTLLIVPICPADASDCDEVYNYELIASDPAWKPTTGLGRPDQTLTFSSSVNSKSIRLIFGRIDCSLQVLEAEESGPNRSITRRLKSS